MSMPRQGAPDPAPVAPVAAPVAAPQVLAPTGTVPTAPAPSAAPVAPVTVVTADAVMSVTCPSCGTVGEVDPLRRSAQDFCGSCEYPLFWAVERVALPVEDRSEDSLRRLPGTAGRAVLASLRCPHCTEPNVPSATLCVRCGAELRPKPVVVVQAPAPEPVVVVAPPPAGHPWWHWAIGIAAIVLVAVGIVLAIVLTAN
jgi:hypothetical protein